MHQYSGEHLAVLQEELQRQLAEIQLAYETEIDFHRYIGDLNAQVCHEFNSQLTELYDSLYCSIGAVCKLVRSLYFQALCKGVAEKLHTVGSRLRNLALLGGMLKW